MTMVKSLSFFIATTIFLVSVALAIPVVFSDSEPIKGYLLQKVGDAIGGHVTTEHLELQLFASPKVRLNQLVVKNQEDGRRLLQLEDGDCELEFLALVIGQVVINHCTLNGLAITLRREQDGSWSWLIFPAAEEDSGTSLVTFAGLKKLGVNNSHITLVDETDPRNPRSIVLSHLEAMMAVKVESRQIDFEASAVPVDTESPATLAIAGHIQAQLHAQTFSVQQASAKIEAINVELRSLLEFIQPGMVFAAKTPIGNLQAALSLFPDQAGYTLVAEEFSASIGALNIRGKTSITGLSSQQPAFIFTATAPAFKVKTLTQLIPSKWLPEDVQRVLSTYQHGGTIEVEHITVSGPLTDDADFSVIGKFLMSNGWIKLNSSSSRLRNIQGSVVLNHDHLTLHDVALEYDSSKILNAFGRIEFREPHPSLTLTINANILADDVLKTARQYHAGTPYLPVWLDLQHVEGDADLRLTIEGLLTSPKKLKAHHGELAIRNLGFRPTTYPLSIQALSGHIRFDQDHLTMDGFSAEYESSKILRASGRIEFREPQPMLTMTASATILAKDALKTVRQLDAIKQNPPSWLDLQSVEGDAAVTLMIEGPLAELGELKIQQGELRVRNLGFQPSGFPLAVRTLFGTIGFDQDHAVIQELRGRVGKSRATLLGSVFYGEHHALKDLTLRSQVELSDFKQLFPKLSEAGGLSGGPLGMAMKISGSVKQRIIHMGIDFTPLHVSYPAVFQKPSGIPMQLKFDGMFKSNQILTIHQTSLEMPPFHLNMKGELSVDDPRIFDVTLTTGSDKNTFFPTGVVIGSEQLGIRQLEANLRIKGTGEDWSAWQTSGILHVNKQDTIATQTARDTQKTARIQWSQENNLVKLEFRTQDLPLEAVIPKEDSAAPKIRGNLTADLSLETALTHSQSLTRSIMGKGEFQIRDGYIVQSPVISRILGLLNLPNLLMGKVDLAKEGVPFNSLTGTFTMTNGLVNSNNRLLNSPVIKMTAAGHYDAPEDQLDFIFAVSPFGEYSNLLKSIPLFGRLLKGERKGLTTALFEVKGSRTEPQVTYQPLKSFTEGLQGFAQFAVDVLKNTITLPKDLITEPEEENVSPR